MSTAIMHQSALYDFGDLHIKNQSHSSVQTMGGVGAAAAAAAAVGTMVSGTGGWADHHPALSRATSLPAHRALGALLDRLGQHRRLERTLSEPAPPPALSAAAAAAPATPSHTSRYKTELCRPFEEAGVCKYGDKCQFAHGYRELRNLQRHPKYKTELCRTFHSVGFCPYGPRCHFVHNAEEARRRDPPSPGGSLASLSSASSAYASYDGSRSPHSPDAPDSPNSPHSPHSPRSPPALSPPAFAFRRPRSPPPTPPPTAADDPTDEARLPVFNRLAAFGDLVIA